MNILEQLMKEKEAFAPMPGGQMPQPAVDPAMQGAPAPAGPAAPQGAPAGPAAPQGAPAPGGQQMDPETGLPIDPQTGLPLDPQSGMLIDVANDAIIDPQTMQPVGQLSQMMGEQGQGAPQGAPQQGGLPGMEQQPPEPTIGELTVSEFAQLMQELMAQVFSGGPEERSEKKTEKDGTNERLDQIIGLLGGGMEQEAPAGMMGMGAGVPAPAPTGMEVQGSDQSIVNTILSRVKG